MLRLLKGTKGSMLGKTAKGIVGVYMKKKNFGKLEDFDIDMSEKKLNISFTPKYFSEVLTIEAREYNIVRDEKKQKNYLTFDSIETSGNWDNSEFKKLIKNKRIEIPEKYKKFIDLVVQDLKNKIMISLSKTQTNYVYVIFIAVYFLCFFI